MASITNELRKYSQSWREASNLMDDLDAGDIDGLLGDIEHIADRIDAKYQKAIRELNDLADASVLLPVDADGETIHVEDMLDCIEIRSAFGRPPTSEIYEEFAQRAGELGIEVTDGQA